MNERDRVGLAFMLMAVLMAQLPALAEQFHWAFAVGVTVLFVIGLGLWHGKD